MPRRLLVVINTEVADDALRDLVRSRAGNDAEMLVVAPAAEISRLDWPTNAEDDPVPKRRRSRSERQRPPPLRMSRFASATLTRCKQSKMRCARSPLTRSS